MSRIARSQTATSPKLEQLRVMIVSAFFVGMAAGVLLALGWDVAFPGYHPATIDTDILVKEAPAIAEPAS